MFSEMEQKAINEKLGLLAKVKNKNMSAEELSSMLTRKRMKWLEKHIDEMKEKYWNLSPQEQAYNIIFLECMKINPEHQKITRIENKIKIFSYNFCPYLEACNLLGLDTRIVCRQVNRKSIEKMVMFINPNLRFYRNYNNIRPYTAFCSERIE